MSAFTIRPAPQPLYFDPDGVSTYSAFGPQMLLAAAHGDLEDAHAALAAAVRAQDPDRHFRGLPECPRVIAAYDAVRAAEGEVARLEHEGRR